MKYFPQNTLSKDRYSKFFHYDHNSLASSHRVRPKDREPTDQDTYKKRDYVHPLTCGRNGCGET